MSAKGIASFQVVMDTSKDLNANVVFSGGTNMSPRLGEGMAKEFTSLAPFTMKIMVMAPRERRCLMRICGSVLSSLTAGLVRPVREVKTQNASSHI